MSLEFVSCTRFYEVSAVDNTLHIFWKGMHYHFALLKYLLDIRYTVALINPTTTDLTRKLQGGITKNDPLDSLTICDVIGSNQRKNHIALQK